MAYKIPEETLTEIRSRISIVEVISVYVSLRKAGKNYTGLCPFPRGKDAVVQRQRRARFFSLFRLWGRGECVYFFMPA